MKSILAARRARSGWPQSNAPSVTVLLADAERHGDTSSVRLQWVRCRDGRVTDAAQASLGEPCPWDTVRKGCPVTLVVRDQALDIERLASHGFGATPLGVWQRYRLARRRRQDGDPGTLVWLGRSASPDARAALQRESAGVEWIDRLAPLVRDGLNIDRVSLPERLLAASRARSEVACFTALQESAHVRHVLVIDGVACFSRRVPTCSDAGVMAVDIVASMSHALDRWSLTRVALDVTDLPARVAGELEPLLDDVPVLVERGVDTGVPVTEPGQATALLAARLAVRAGGSKVLAPLNAPWRQRRAYRRLGLVCLGCCLPALGLALHVATVGARSVKAARSLDVQRTEVLSVRRATLSDVAELHPEPERAQRFLTEFDRLAESPGSTPEALLVGVARAMTRHEALTLAAFAWSHRALDAGDAADDLTDAAVDEAVFVDAISLPFAHRSDAERLNIELEGRVMGTLPLREAQSRVHALAADLDALAAFSACRVMRSPLSGAARGESASPSAMQVDAAAWQLRCAFRTAAR